MRMPSFREFGRELLLVPGLILAVIVCVDARQRPAFRSTIDLVMLSVTVTGPGGRYVSDLSADDFHVLEDGRPQEVAFFSPANVPLSVSLVLDTSSSMDDEMVLSKQAAMDFIAKLRPGDVAEVVSFDSRVEVLQPMTSDRVDMMVGHGGGIIRREPAQQLSPLGKLWRCAAVQFQMPA
jgi:von Willebrand factor type A domain